VSGIAAYPLHTPVYCCASGNTMLKYTCHGAGFGCAGWFGHLSQGKSGRTLKPAMASLLQKAPVCDIKALGRLIVKSFF
jgi:hypothetical protein